MLVHTTPDELTFLVLFDSCKSLIRRFLSRTTNCSRMTSKLKKVTTSIFIRMTSRSDVKLKDMKIILI